MEGLCKVGEMNVMRDRIGVGIKEGALARPARGAGAPESESLPTSLSYPCLTSLARLSRQCRQ